MNNSDKVFKKIIFVLTFIHIYLAVLNRIFYGIFAFFAVRILDLYELDRKVWAVSYNTNQFYLGFVYGRPGLFRCILIITILCLLVFGAYRLLTGKENFKLFITVLAINILLPVAAVLRLAIEFGLGF